MKYTTIIFVLCSLALFSCKSGTDATATTPSGLTGTIYYNPTTGGASNGVYKLSLNANTITQIGYLYYPNVLANNWILGWVNTGDLGELSPDGLQTKVIVKEHTDAPFTDIYDDKFLNMQVSPDGNYIAYDGHQHVFVVDINGNLIHTYGDANTAYSRPSWGPDGTIYMQGEYGSYGIFMDDKNFTHINKIDPNLSHPVHPKVSPDGKMIAFILGDHVWIMKTDGTGLLQLTTGSNKQDYPI